MGKAPLIDLLQRLTLLLRTQGRQRAAEQGLNPVQAEALAFLARANRYSDQPSAVAEYLGASRGTTSQTLKRLAERGLLRASADPADGRRVHLRVTSKGRRAAQALAQAELGGIVQATERLAPAERERLRGDLEQLLRSLQRAHGSRTFGICRTCRHFRAQALGDRHRCGLTLEPLADEESGLVCREHEYSSSPGAPERGR